MVDNTLLKGRKLKVHVDNEALYHIYNNGGSMSQKSITRMRICKKLFWFQIEYDYEWNLSLEWVPTRARKQGR